jgi:hypothetical protein
MALSPAVSVMFCAGEDFVVASRVDAVSAIRHFESPAGYEQRGIGNRARRNLSIVILDCRL